MRLHIGQIRNKMIRVDVTRSQFLRAVMDAASTLLLGVQMLRFPQNDIITFLMRPGLLKLFAVAVAGSIGPIAR